MLCVFRKYHGTRDTSLPVVQEMVLQIRMQRAPCAWDPAVAPPSPHAFPLLPVLQLSLHHDHSLLSQSVGRSLLRFRSPVQTR